ncbi:MAG: AI-2E family transporter [Gemmatimonadota bacterium]|nr:AI-2E family transporter [Gemmatimonadota bacterium]
MTHDSAAHVGSPGSPPVDGADDSALKPQADLSAPPADAAGAAAGRPEDITRITAAVESPQARGVALTILAILALTASVYFARPFLLPITLAVLLNLLLSPVIRALARMHIPPALGAGLVIILFLGGLGVGIYQLATPAETWIARAPAAFAQASERLRRVTKPVERVTKAAEQVERATDVQGTNKPPEVVVKGASLVSRVFGTTESLVALLLEVLLLLYFLLASGDFFLQKLIKVLPRLGDREKAVTIARETEASISRYLLTTALLNAGEGVVVGIAMKLWGMPNPLLWGALIAILEFVPYLGALTMVVVLTLVAVATFTEMGRALAVPATFIAINFFWGNVVSPLMMSKRLTLNPVAIFVGLAFWFWLWGIPGAFIAVPVLATFKIFCDNIETLAPIGEFLGGRDPWERRSAVRLDAGSRDR